MSQTVLVTGAAGRLGRAAMRALSEAGHEVRAVDVRYEPDLPVPVRMLDLLEDLPVYEALEGCDAVVHLANHPGPHSCPSPQRLYRENVTTNFNVFRAAADVGVRRTIYSSSVQAICGTRHDREDADEPSCLPYLPLDGEVPACPGNAYALSKEAGERQLRYFARMHPERSCTAIRFPFLLREKWRHWLRHRHGGREHVGNLDEGFTYLAMPDAASLLAAVVERQGPGYHQLFPAAPDPYVDMPIPEIIEQFYADVPCRVAPEEMESLVDISAIRQELDWAPEHVDLFAGEGGSTDSLR
ncbi:MAG: NAD-dependent epimerase/dehydratase family protein [Planctomycetota bacterium]